MPPSAATHGKSYRNPCIMLQIRELLHELKESGPFPNTSIVHTYYFLLRIGDYI